MKILIVDGLPAMRRIITKVLRELGFSNIQEADDGNSALRMLQNDKFAFLMTDWNMPGTTGIELFKVLRSHRRGGFPAPSRAGA